MKRAAAVVLASLAVVACAPARAPEPPPLVLVEVHGAMVAPSKPDGALWDPALGTDRMAIDPFQKVVSLGAAPPSEWIGRAAAIGAVVGAAGVQHLARPDPYGFATLESPGTAEERDLVGPSGAEVEDDFHAVFRLARFSPVVLQDSVRLTVQLRDRDSGSADDAIGTVVITGEDLRAALELGRGRVVPVLTASQGASTIAFVDVAVTKLR